MAGRRLNRKARWAVTVLALLILAIVAVTLRSCIIALQSTTIVAEAAPGEDEIVKLGKKTIFLEQASVGSKIIKWLNSGTGEPRAFIVEDSAFAPGTDALTPEGSDRVERFVDLLNDRKLRAQVFITTHEGADAEAQRQLAARRAERIRTEVIAKGVSGSRISTSVRPISNEDARKSPPPAMILVLSKVTD